MKQQELHFHTLVQWGLDLLALFVGCIATFLLFSLVPEGAAQGDWQRAMRSATLLAYSAAYFWYIGEEDALTLKKTSRYLLRKCLFLVPVLLIYILRTGRDGKKLLLSVLIPVTCFLFLLAERSILRILRAKAYRDRSYSRNTILITDSGHRTSFEEYLRSDDCLDMHLIAVCETEKEAEQTEGKEPEPVSGGEKDPEAAESSVTDEEKRGTAEGADKGRRLSALPEKGKVRYIDAADIRKYVHDNPVGYVFCVLPEDRMEEWSPLLDDLAESGLCVRRSMPQISRAQKGTPYLFGTIRGRYFLEFNPNGFEQRMFFVKRIVDIVVGLLGCVVLIPASLFAVPACLITQGAPVFEKTRCVGRDGNRFSRLRFRAKKGGIMEKSHLSFMPEFMNVLVGDMSLIGVRCVREDTYAKNEIAYRKCLMRKPGMITPAAPEEAENEKEGTAHLAADIEYVEHWSLWTDVVTIMENLRASYEKKHRITSE